MAFEHGRPQDPDPDRVAAAIDALARVAAADEDAFRGLSLLLADYCMAKSEAEFRAERLRAQDREPKPAVAFAVEAGARERTLDGIEELTSWQRQLLRTVTASLSRPMEAGDQVDRLVRVIAGRSVDLDAYRRETALLTSALIRALIVPSLGVQPINGVAAWLFAESEARPER